MKTLESMKQFIRENNFTALVNELVTGADMDVADAVEYVYDMKTLSKAQFASKYFGLWSIGGNDMFKKLVKAIAAIQSENDRDECYWQIDRAFEEERISFEDHELLYGLAGMVEVA